MRNPALIAGPFRVLSFQRFLPADPPQRKKHMVQLWTDPGGMRTLNVGCIRLKDPGKVAAGKAAAATRAEEAANLAAEAGDDE